MPRDDDAMRYRQAANMALDQLGWCVEYFRSIRKTSIAKHVARNRAAIARSLEDASQGTRLRGRR